MPARRPIAAARPGSQRAHRFKFILLLALSLGPLAAPPAQGYTLNQTGRWTPTKDLGGTEVHMALLPSDGQPWHSKVLWWYGRGHHEHSYAGILRWKPGEYDCTNFPSTSLIKDTVVVLPPNQAGVFCSSESHLPSGELFLAGGTQPGTEYGVSHAFTFDPASENWTEVDSMGSNVRRYYPTSCALASGKQLVLSGTRHQQIEFFGGLSGGNLVPTDSALFRYGIGGKGVVDGAVRQSMTPAQWPQPREGHSALFFNGVTHVFGGKSRGGIYLNDYWHQSRVDAAAQSDYDYSWEELPVPGAPSGRWEHSAIAVTNDTSALMIVHGGVAKIGANDVVLNDVWRLRWSSTSGYLWQQITVTTPPAPVARWGHAALYDAPRKRMLMFGGRSATTGDPTDGTLWALNFSSGFSSATWESLSATGPSPRFDHAIGWSPNNPDSAYLFGGDRGTNGKAGDLWLLTVGATPSWQAITDLGGQYPPARSKHTVTVVGHLVMVFGGLPNDSTVHVAHVESVHEEEIRQWTTFTANEAALSGHTAIFSGAPAAGERIPQIYDPAAQAGSRWSPLTSVPRLFKWYPQAFVWTPDTVFVSGPDFDSYKLALGPTPAWVKYPQGGSTLEGGSAVMYRPGRVMKCGSRDTDPVPSDGYAIGTTQSIDLSQQASGLWRDSDNAMAPRENHNLVLLPNGKVLVVGGHTRVDDPTWPERRPEIWDPEYINGAKVGRWEGLGVLDTHTVVRDYHSTALLLPDGRVLIGGGNANEASRSQVEIFCPPYLFRSDGYLATRPALMDPPRTLRYGAQTTLTLVAADTISMISLIRPAAVTHGHDQNQRLVPLRYSQNLASGPRCLNDTLPSSSADAPPGDYLLFVVNNKGVPSVAKWIRLVPSSDVTAPASVTDLTRDMVASNGVHMTWTAPGDDGWTGTATQVELRYSLSPITADNFCQATAPATQPAPGTGGSARNFAVTGLAPCKTYYFAIKYWDEINNVAAFGDTMAATTLCDDCCSGEVRARAPGEEGSREGVRAGGPNGAAVTPSTAAPTSGANGLVVEAIPGSGGLDLRAFVPAEESTAADGAVLLQRPDAAGHWVDWLDYDLLAAHRFALCVPEAPARWVFRTATSVAGVFPATGESGAAWRLASARHSRLGDATATLTPADSLPGLGEGDTLIARYEAAPDTGTLAPGWMLLLDRAAGETSAARAGRRPAPEGQALPAAFALHPTQPNPFAGRVTIRFALPVASQVRIDVFDLVGRKVRTLADSPYDAGEFEISWDRRNTRGALAAPGLYFCRMEAGAFRAKRAMVMVP